MSNEEKWYNPNKLFSHNAFLNMVMSPRGNGKSYSAKKLIIKNWLKNGKQCAYVRRTKVELDSVKEVFWNDIATEFPELEFSTKGYTGLINGEVVVYFLALSVSLNYKSSSYPNVNWIIFDEYIVTKSSFTRYLKNEMTLFFDLLETVFRTRDDVRVYIMANTISYVNPLFSFFKIEPNNGNRFNKYENGLICVECFTSTTFIEEKKKTKLGRLISNTDYGRYAIDNIVLEDTNDFIIPREGNFVFVSSFKSSGYEIGVWLNQDEMIYYCDNKLDRSNKNKFALLVEDVEPGYIHISEQRNNWRVKNVKKAYNNGQLFFSSQEVKKFFQDIVIRFI